MQLAQQWPFYPATSVPCATAPPVLFVPAHPEPGATSLPTALLRKQPLGILTESAVGVEVKDGVRVKAARHTCVGLQRDSGSCGK